MSHEWRNPRRLALGIVWLTVITVAAFGALVHRPPFADVQSSGSVFLVLFGIPAVLLALAVIRSFAVLVPTAALSAAWSATTSWSTMRSASSTAAIGVFLTPIIATVIVAIGCGISVAWNLSSRRRRRDALAVSALASSTRSEPGRESG